MTCCDIRSTYWKSGGDPLQDGNFGQRWDIGRSHGVEHQVVHPSLAESVGTHQRIHWNAVLGQPTGVFDRGARCIHSLQRDAVAQSVQQSIDVAFDAGTEELHEQGVAAHLRNFILDEKLYVRG
jgi:hypothetical protein